MHHSSPRVSVIVPAYNMQSFIGDTLESAVNQTFRSFEIIVVDDGSTDGTASVVEKFRDRGVTLLRQANSGIGPARNHALSIARGELIALLDADDLWEPQYLEVMVGFLDQHPDVAIAFSDTLFFGKSKFAGRRHQEVYPPSTPITFAKLASGVSHISVAAVIRKEVFSRIGLFEASAAIKGGGEDFELWLRVLHKGLRIEPVGQVLVRYRRHVDSLSSSVPLEKAALYVLGKWRGHPGLTEVEKQTVETSYAAIESYLEVRSAIHHINDRQYSMALAALRRACEQTPKWRYRAAQLALAICPGLMRVALRRITE